MGEGHSPATLQRSLSWDGSTPSWWFLEALLASVSSSVCNKVCLLPEVIPHVIAETGFQQESLGLQSLCSASPTPVTTGHMHLQEEGTRESG